MTAIRTRLLLVLALTGILEPYAVRSSALAEVQTYLAAQGTETTAIERDAKDEARLIARLQELSRRDHSNDPAQAARSVRLLEQQETLELIDDLLKRYPETRFRDDALIIQLGILAEYSRIRPEYLEQLLALTREIGGSHPSKKLAAETDFYAIQGFVYAARNEGMPEERRRLGTEERYRAFLADHPDSPRRPIVYASLVRVLVQQEEHAEARALLERFRNEFPKHEALARAEGEVAQRGRVGQPFDFALLTAVGGKSITDALRSKVVVVHFWASWADASTDLVTELESLYELYGQTKLAVVGVSVDTDRQALDAALDRLRMPWPQLSSLKGFKCEVVVGSGVVTLPTTLVIDREGILRAVSDGSDLRNVLRKLIPSKDSG